MSASAIPTVYNMGVKRLTTLGGFSTDILTGMLGDGYDPSTINQLFADGATDAQMQYLWDNFGAGTPEFAAAAYSLHLNLTKGTGIIQQQPTGTQFQNALKASGAIPVGLPWDITPPAQTYAASSPAGRVNLPPSLPPGATDWTAWLQNNAGKILLVVALVAVVPPLVKKL